jgi:hypothetical protein
MYSNLIGYRGLGLLNCLIAGTPVRQRRGFKHGERGPSGRCRSRSDPVDEKSPPATEQTRQIASLVIDNRHALTPRREMAVFRRKIEIS